MMLAEVGERIKETKKTLRQFGYSLREVSAKEFCDYMTGEIFSKNTTTLRDVLDSEYLMVHELIEISELKKMGRTIDKHVIVNSPKTVIYTAHFNAMEKELDYALLRKDYSWIKTRLKHHNLVMTDDPNLPEEMMPRAKVLMEKFRKALGNTVDRENGHK
ncbi:MAG: hypothetical protein ACQXXH_04065 [Candidatus Bathyarchaeia archaeon]|jgi:hypothetical protein|nr:hypothetical protein [Candidatus Bathyarchaeota archaeon A05DMB-4]MDH7594914.1 hypothetical protein [Candidatus Bathyarchaeota archaeon]